MHERAPATFPSGQGTDLAGVVRAVGDGVTVFSEGDEVLGWSEERSSQAELVAVPAEQLTVMAVIRAGVLKLGGGMLGKLLAAEAGLCGPCIACVGRAPSRSAAYRDKVIAASAMALASRPGKAGRSTRSSVHSTQVRGIEPKRSRVAATTPSTPAGASDATIDSARSASGRGTSW